jgi:hypothetical protein
MRNLAEGQRTFASPEHNAFTVVLNEQSPKGDSIMFFTINRVDGDSDGATLEGYQFISVAGSNTLYNFCTPVPASAVVVTDPPQFTNGEEFKFDLALSTNPTGKKYKWKIKDYTLGSESPGDWSNDHKKSEFADDDDGEKGTFTAQSGIEEDAKGKPAKAY